MFRVRLVCCEFTGSPVGLLVRKNEHGAARKPLTGDDRSDAARTPRPSGTLPITNFT